MRINRVTVNHLYICFTNSETITTKIDNTLSFLLYSQIEINFTSKLESCKSIINSLKFTRHYLQDI